MSRKQKVGRPRKRRGKSIMPTEKEVNGTMQNGTMQVVITGGLAKPDYLDSMGLKTVEKTFDELRVRDMWIVDEDTVHYVVKKGVTILHKHSYVVIKRVYCESWNKDLCIHKFKIYGSDDKFTVLERKENRYC